MGMGFLGDDNASDGSKKKESSIIITKSTKASSQGDIRPGELVCETNWCIKRCPETVFQSISVHNKNKQTKSKVCKETRVEQYGSSERIDKTGTHPLDRMDKEQSTEVFSKTASSTGDNNNGCSSHGIGCHNTFNFIYTDLGQLAQAMRGMVFNNVPSFQQQTRTCGHPQSVGGIYSNYYQKPLELYPDPNGQYNSMLQIQPQSSFHQPLSLPPPSSEPNRCIGSVNNFRSYTGDPKHRDGQIVPSGYERDYSLKQYS
jgi:hypothetical protein